MKLRASALSFTLACILVLGYTAVAQPVTRSEVGINTAILPSNRLGSFTDVGIGLRYTYNISSNLGIDSEVDSYLTNTNPVQANIQFGGRASLVLLGLKAGIRAQRYGVFFRAAPGAMSFSDALTSASIFGSHATTRRTHAVLGLGIASEFYPSSLIVLRLDAGTLLVRYGSTPEFSFPTFAGIATVSSKGSIGAPSYLSVGAAFRLGSFRPTEGAAPFPESQRFQIGGQYSLLTLERSAQTVRDESAVGGWFTWNFYPHLDFDSSITFFPRQVRFVDFQQGGRIFQALAGVRSGIRRGRIGVFGKFRPGLQLYTLTVQNQQTQKLTPFGNLAFDAGGIIEVYTSRHTLLRFDAGNTIIHYRARSTVGFDGITTKVPAFTRSTIQLTSGFGFRW